MEGKRGNYIALAVTLSALGALLLCSQAALESARAGLNLCAHNDHRMAMSLALLALLEPGLRMETRLDDPTVVRKSFPQFWNVWSRLQ